jgi:AraC-like DNA-binding protein
MGNTSDGRPRGMIIHVKNMVSLRCKMKVKEEQANLGLHHGAVDLGAVEVLDGITSAQRRQLGKALLRSGLELMDDRKAILVERIRNVVTKMVHGPEELPKVKFSIFLSEEMGYDYTYLANTFSEIKHTTIEQFLIASRIERAKELLLDEELNLTEISYKLRYSSVAHLSGQFKKVTGLTPTLFKRRKQKRKVHLEDM